MPDEKPDFTDALVVREWLRKPFPPELVGTLPRTDKRPAFDYVGHAAVTDRLNKCAPEWTYHFDKIVEVTLDDHLPHVLAVFGTMTIGGVSRQEVGAVDSVSTYGDELKKGISDFIRRGAMRFGVAIDLWSKEDLLTSEATVPEVSPVASGNPSEGAGTMGKGSEPSDDNAAAASTAGASPGGSSQAAPPPEGGVVPSTTPSGAGDHDHVHVWGPIDHMVKHEKCTYVASDGWICNATRKKEAAAAL